MYKLIKINTFCSQALTHSHLQLPFAPEAGVGFSEVASSEKS